MISGGLKFNKFTQILSFPPQVLEVFNPLRLESKKHENANLIQKLIIQRNYQQVKKHKSKENKPLFSKQSSHLQAADEV